MRTCLHATATFMELSMMRERLPTRPALVTSSRGARILKNTSSECTACKMLSTCMHTWTLVHHFWLARSKEAFAMKM